MRKYSFIPPKTMDALFQAVADNAGKRIRFVAGATDFMPRLHTEQDELPKGDEAEMVIISLMGLGLNQVQESDTEVRIGACCILNDLAANAVIKKEFPVLVQAIQQIAGLTVRNAGTLGGNIVNASPAADSVPALVVLDAKFVAAGPNGTREIPAAEFFTGPGKTVLAADEILTEIVIAKNAGKGCFLKLGRRKAETLSTVNAAAYIEAENGICKAVRVAIGACAPTIVKATAVEEALCGKELSDENIDAAAAKVLDMICPIDDIRASAWYRKKIAPVMVKRAIKGSI